MRTRYAAFRLAQWLSGALPPSGAFGLAERLADAQCRRSAEDRAAVAANLSHLRGSEPSAELVREVFRNFGRYLVEFFTIHRVRHPAVSVSGAEHLDEIRRAGRGAIILTAHVGNWEVGAVVLRRMGLPLTVVALEHADARMNQLFDRQRQRCGLEVVSLGAHAAQHCLQRLREGRMIELLGDRDFMHNGLSVNLRGAPVTVPKGPAILSLRARVPVVPTFLIREGRWKFRLCLEPPLWPERSGGGSSVDAFTQRYAKILERYLTRYPEQWLMFRPMASSAQPLPAAGVAAYT